MRACNGNRGFIAERNYHTDLLWNYENFKRLAALPRCHRRWGTLPRCSLSRRGLSPPVCCPPRCATVCRGFALSSQCVGCRPRHRRRQHEHCRGLAVEEPGSAQPLAWGPPCAQELRVAPQGRQRGSKAKVQDEVLLPPPQTLCHPCPASLMFPGEEDSLLSHAGGSQMSCAIAAVSAKRFQLQQRCPPGLPRRDSPHFSSFPGSVAVPAVPSG